MDHAATETLLAAVAGEASSDLLGAAVFRELRQHSPAMVGVGIGGERMSEVGFTCWHSSDELAVRGVVEVVRHLPRLLRLRRHLAQRLIANPPKLFLGIDAPDFNLGLERKLKQAGIATAHFISPSIWAWRRERLNRISESVDLMLCLFPFEPELYKNTGVHAEFVGHPLADTIPLAPDRAAAKARLGLPTDQPVLAVLPGSRQDEIRHIAPVFIRSARTLAERFAIHPIVAAVSETARQQITKIDGGQNPLTVVTGKSHTLMEAADLALVASGTASLECTLYKVPMVVGYAMPSISYQILKRRAYLPWVSLPNILLKKTVVPELLQANLNESNLVAAASAWLDSPTRIAEMIEQFDFIHNALRRNAAWQVAQVLQADL